MGSGQLASAWVSSVLHSAHTERCQQGRQGGDGTAGPCVGLSLSLRRLNSVLSLLVPSTEGITEHLGDNPLLRLLDKVLHSSDLYFNFPEIFIAR